MTAAEIFAAGTETETIFILTVTKQPTPAWGQLLYFIVSVIFSLFTTTICKVDHKIYHIKATSS